VSFIDENTGTAVGWSGTILRTTDGGATWTSQISGTTETLYCVSLADEDNGIAVGWRDTILRTTNAGATWSSYTSGTGAFFNAVSFADESTAVAVGFNGAVFRTTDRGETWESQEAPYAQYHDVTFSNAWTGTAVGRYGAIIRTTTGGTWTHGQVTTLPEDVRLSQNYPNPFNPSTTIDYALPRSSYVKLEVFNVLGERVSVLRDGVQDAGYHSLVFDAKGLPSGMYFYKLQAQDFVETKKSLLLR